MEAPRCFHRSTRRSGAVNPSTPHSSSPSGATAMMAPCASNTSFGYFVGHSRHDGDNGVGSLASSPISISNPDIIVFILMGLNSMRIMPSGARMFGMVSTTGVSIRHHTTNLAAEESSMLSRNEMSTDQSERRRSFVLSSLFHRQLLAYQCTTNPFNKRYDMIAADFSEPESHFDTANWMRETRVL
eukprot:IDg4229t1